MAIVGTIADEFGDSLLIKLASPYENITEILSFEDEVLGETSGSFFERSFRWSVNNITYSDWIELTDENLQTLELNSSKQFWIQYRYEVASLETGVKLEFVSISLEILTARGTLQVVPQVNISDDNCNAQPNLLVEDCDEIFDPYDVSRAITNYKQLSCLVSDIFGHTVRYFHFKPDDRSRDVILKEFSLYRGSKVKEFKIMVPDNELPTRELAFDMAGINMPDSPFEIHIVKNNFETAFGTGERPGVQDVIWFPLMDRLYEINSITLPDDFLYESTYYRVTIDVFQDRSNRLFDSEDAEVMEEELDDLGLSLEDVFGDERADEEAKIRKDIQYNTLSTGEKDFVRKQLNEKLVIKEFKIRNNFTVVSKYFYKLDSLDSGETALVYRHNKGIVAAEDRAFTFWMRPHFRNPIGNPVIVDVIALGTEGKALFSTLVEHGYEIGDFVRITGTVDYNGIHKVISSSTLSFTLDVDFVSDAGISPKARKQEANQFISYGTDSDGFSITVGQEMIVVRLKDYDIIFDTKGTLSLNNNQWYAIVINFGNQFDQMSLFVYEIEETTGLPSENATSELRQLFTETKNITDETLVVSDDQEWKILGTNLDFTNFRIFSLPIEEEEHSLVLSQFVVADTHLSLLVDNAFPQLRLVRVGNPR